MYLNGNLESTSTANASYRTGYVSTLGTYNNASIRFWKGSRIKTLLEKSLDYIGYTYQSSIAELDNIFILPISILRKGFSFYIFTSFI